MAQALESPSLAWGIWQDERLAGFMVVQVLPDAWELLNLAVQGQYQRQGLATQLMHFLLQQAQRQQIAEIWLEVRHANVAAQDLYQKCGFVVVGRRKGYYVHPQGGREDALLMAHKGEWAENSALQANL